MFKVMGSDFDMVEGEGILRVSNENQFKKGKIKIWEVRKKEKGE